MSSPNQNANALPHAIPGPAPVLEGVSSSPARPAPFSQPFIPQSGGPSEPPAFNFQVRRSLRMHGTLAVMVGLAVCLLLVALGLKEPRTYKASSVIYVEPMVARNLNEQGVPGFDQFRYGSFLDQQMQTIVRPDVLTAALRSLPAGTWRGPLESEQSAVARLSKALTVERVLTSYQITVQLKASDPDAAAAIVNAVTSAYLQRGREDEFKQADLREQILSEERDRVKEELETDRKEQAALGASMGLASPADGAGNPYDADLAGLRSQLATAREARDVAAAQLESVTGQDADHRSGLKASADDVINSDPGLSAKKAAVNARRVVLESMMAGMTPSNPQYRQAQDEIADLDRALEAKTVEVRVQTERRIQDKLRTDLQRTADVESKLNAQLAQATSKATGAGPKLQRAAELANDIQRLTARYTAVDDTLNALELETSGPGMAHVPLPAAVPLSPEPNHRDLFFMAALPLGILCGVAAAVLARMRDRRVYLGSDLQHAIGFAPIAVLPARADVSDRVIKEYVLRLAAGVESAYRTAGAQSFVVTAVSPDTGIGTLLDDLENKLEDLRLRVIVIKASELLVTSQETMEHQAATAALLAAGGQRTIQAGEGIASAKLDRMKGQTDIILIDAAPVLHSAETEYAARCADATILVAESAITQTTELAAATALLSRLRVTGVGAVLDEVKLEQADEQFRSAVRVIEQRSVEGVVDRKQPVQRETVAATKPAVAAPKPPVAAPRQAAQPASAQVDTLKAVLAETIAAESLKTAPKPAANPVQARDTPGTLIPKPVMATPASVPAAVAPATPAKPMPVQPEPPNPVPATVVPARPAAAASVPANAPVPTPPRPTSPSAAVQAIPAPAPSRPIVPQVPAVAASASPAIQPAPNILQPVVASTPPVAPQPTDNVLPPQTPRRSFKTWTAQPEISPEEAEQVIARPGVRRRFELLGDLADAAPVARSFPAAATGTNGNSAHAVATAPSNFIPPAHPEPQRAALHAASAKMQIGPPISQGEVKRPANEPAKGDDPHAVGRFVGEKDNIGAVPPYTRSRIRLAFKEQEVNSKTTWFSKLFRGDPPSSFKIIPEETEDDDESMETPKLLWEQPPARLPEPVADGDPELSHLLNRIKTSGETKIAPRPRPVAVEPEPVFSGPPVPFVERRTAPRPIEIDEYRAPVAAPAAFPAPGPVAVAPEPPVWQPPVPTPLTPPLAAAPASFAAPTPPPAPAPFSPGFVPNRMVSAPPEPASRPYGRPLRPLTFQQLAGSIEAEALHQQPPRPLKPEPAPVAVAQPLPSAPAEPPVQAAEIPQPLEPFQAQIPVAPVAVVPEPVVAAPAVLAPIAAAPVAEVAAETPVQPPAVTRIENPWEIPAIPQQSAPEPVAPPTPPAPVAPVTSVGHTGMPLWPAKEPMVSSYAPPYHAPEPTPAPIHAAADVEAIDSDVVAPEAVIAEPETSFAHEEPLETPRFIPPSPSARRGSFERIPIIPDPLTDPSPAQRPYRLEPMPEVAEHAAVLEPAPAAVPAAVATVPAGTFVAPDHEARLQFLGRRKTDRADADAEVPGLTRRWKLLSQFEPVVTDPLPAHRKGYTRATDVNPPRRSDEG